jgi:hypothetical protein
MKDQEVPKSGQGGMCEDVSCKKGLDQAMKQRAGQSSVRARWSRIGGHSRTDGKKGFRVFLKKKTGRTESY